MTLIYRDNYFKIEKLKISQLNQTLYKNYEKNRPADEKRIEDMIIALKDENIVPGIVCVWEKNNEYFIYDGLHRIKCAFRLYNNLPNIDLYIIIKTFTMDNEEIILKDFENINKSVSIPLMYIQKNNERKKAVCENVVMWLCKNYPKFVSPSQNFKKPNFNRDVLLNNFCQIEKLDSCLCSNEELENKLIILLQKLNFKARDKFKNAIKKCSFEQFYLFNYDIYIICKFIEKRLS